MTQHFHRNDMTFENLPNLVICLADCLQNSAAPKKRDFIKITLHCSIEFASGLAYLRVQNSSF